MYLKRKKKDHKLLTGPFLALTDETCQEPFPPFCLHQTFSDQQRGSVCCAGMGTEKGLLCSLAPGWQWGGHCQTNHPFAWKRCEILHWRSHWKIPLQEEFLRARAAQRAGWRYAACRTAPSPVLHRVLLVQGFLSPALGTCVSWPGVKCWNLGKSMHGAAGEGGAWVYPRKSLTHLPQPNTRAFQLPQPLQQGVHTPRDTKRKVNSCEHG